MRLVTNHWIKIEDAANFQLSSTFYSLIEIEVSRLNPATGFNFELNGVKISTGQ